MSASVRIARFSGLLGAYAVAAGAYGSHMLEAGWQERQVFNDDDDDDTLQQQRWKTAWQTGWIMHMTGSVATLAVAALASISNDLNNHPNHTSKNISMIQQQHHYRWILKRPWPIAILIGGGTLVFSTSTYLAAYHADRKYAVGGPIGGSAVILGWLLLAFFP
jgi:uncharacterized membrane protein YgdD (TMEM256/DUF423 family)